MAGLCALDGLSQGRHAVKVVSERLGQSTPAFTMTVYLPGMQRDAADLFPRLVSNGNDNDNGAVVTVAGR